MVPRSRSWSQWNCGSANNGQFRLLSVACYCWCRLSSFILIFMYLLLHFARAYFNLRKRAMMTRLRMPSHLTPKYTNNVHSLCSRRKIEIDFSVRNENGSMRRKMTFEKGGRDRWTVDTHTTHSVDHRSVSRNVAQTFRSLIKRNQILFHSREQHRMAIK